MVLLLAVLTTQVGLHAARPLVSYRTIALGGGGLAVGLAAAAFAALSILMAIPLGRYTDRSGRTAQVLLTGAGLSVVGAAFLALAPTLALAAAASAVMGLAHVCLMVGGQGHVARRSNDRRLDRDFGLLTATVSGGQLVGPLVAGLALGSGGQVTVASTSHAGLIAALVAACSVPFTAALWAIRRIDTATVHVHQAMTPTVKVSNRAILGRPGVLNALFVSMALLSAVDLLTAYLPLVAEERGIAPAVVGALLALRAASSLVSRAALGAMAARWPRRALVSASAFGSGACLAVVALPGMDAAGIAPALVVGGFFLGIGQPLTMTSVVRAVPLSTRGTALALRLVANRAGQVALPTLAGLLTGVLGSAAALWFAGGVLLVAGVSAAAGPDTVRDPDDPSA